MPNIQRKARPDCFRYFLMVLRGEPVVKDENSDDGRMESCSLKKLEAVLVKRGGYKPGFATKTVANAITDGLLMPIHGPRSASTPGGNKKYRLPNALEVGVPNSHDFYCYECHLPGELVQCSQCWRSFHRRCYRKKPQAPNYTVPSSKNQKNLMPSFSSDDESEEELNNTCNSTLMHCENDTTSTSLSKSNGTPQSEAPVQEVDSELYLTKMEEKPEINNVERKFSEDLVCLGQTRPPNKTRPDTTDSNVSYKSEQLLANNEENDINLCTCCRLIKEAGKYNSVNRQADELTYLLSKSYEVNKLWISEKIRSYLENNQTSVADIDVVHSLLMYSPIKSLADIEVKLQRNQYSLLMQFMVDMLDIQHNIGIFFGAYGSEYESTKWMIRDVTHDLNEMKRCPDCFRYSCEKNSLYWFSKPCVIRHELVYAKVDGYPYWPAKVVRLLNKKKKYDVRFFGGEHSRALLNEKYIKPIDADIKLAKTPLLKRAMEELQLYLKLQTRPFSDFSFQANPQEKDNIIRAALERNVSSKRGRKRKKALPVVCPDLKVKVKRLKLHQIQNSETTPDSDSVDAVQEPKGLKETLEEMKKELEKKDAALNMLKQSIEKMQKAKLIAIEKNKNARAEQAILKRKQWCYWCLEEAIYLCCFHASYCTEKCQALHWKESHHKVCKNPNYSSES